MTVLSDSPIFGLAFVGDFDGAYISYNVKGETEKFTLCNKEPETWQDLQYIVYTAFKQLGYLAHLEKKIESVRSIIEIDVFAEKNLGKFDYEKIIIECKHWNSNIPQEIVHSVRTVAEDVGANKAYIIAKKGFQKGAVKAAANSVVKLFTFDDFIKEISESWLKRFKRDYYEELRRIKKYKYLNEMLCWQVGSEKGFETDEKMERYIAIANKYFFLFYHLRFLEQDMKIDLEEHPENYENFISTDKTFLEAMPKSIKINSQIYETNSMMNLYEIIFHFKVVDMLIEELNLFLNHSDGSNVK